MHDVAEHIICCHRRYLRASFKCNGNVPNVVRSWLKNAGAIEDSCRDVVGLVNRYSMLYT